MLFQIEDKRHTQLLLSLYVYKLSLQGAGLLLAGCASVPVIFAPACVRLLAISQLYGSIHQEYVTLKVWKNESKYCLHFQ